MSIGTNDASAAGGGWDGAMANMASALLGIPSSQLKRTFTECERGLNEVASNVSGGTLTFPTSPRGGIAFLQTTATASRFAGFIGVSNGVLGNIKTDVWLFACRTKLSTGDAASSHEMGVAPGVGGIGIISGVNSGVGFIVINGIASLQANNGGALTTVVSTWVVDTTASHDFVVVYNGTTILGYVDGVLVATIATNANVPATAGGHFMNFAANGVTAANRTLATDSIGVWFKQAD